MADTPRLKSPRLEVTLDDGTALEVQTTNPDLIAYERTARKHKWAAPGDAPLTWLTFLAWHALRREHLIPTELGWDSFADERCLGVSNLTDDDDVDDDDAGRPTPPGPGPG